MPPNGSGSLAFNSDEAIAHLKAVDPLFARVVDAVGPFALQPRRINSPFEALARSIVYQQLSGKAAATIFGRVRALFSGRGFPSARAMLQMPDRKLRAAGLSRAKTQAIKDLAEKSQSRVVPSMKQVARLSDSELVERITQVHGIGPWTVEMMLIFSLGRPDVLPIHDYGVRKGFGKVYLEGRLPTPKELLAFGERWRPYRTVPSWYFWRVLELTEERLSQITARPRRSGRA